MDINTADLKKLLELNQKGLISDQVLAEALKERFLKEEVVEKTEEERRQELIEKNRERTNAIREKWLEKAHENEINERNIENNALQDKKIEEMKDFLIQEKNKSGNFVYSREYLDSLSYLELMSIYHNTKEFTKESIDLKLDYIDSLKYINTIKKNGTICLALAKDEDDEDVYVVYQNKYDIIGFDRIDPVAKKYISEAEEEFEKRIKKEEEELKIYDEEESKEEIVEDLTPVVESIKVKKDYLDTLEYLNIIKQEGTICLALAKDENGKTKYVVYQNKYDIIGFDRIDPKPFDEISIAEENFSERVKKEKEDLEIYATKEETFTEPKLEDSKEKIFAEPKLEDSKEEKNTDDNHVIGDINEFDEEDPELGDLDEKAKIAMDPETDSKFSIINISPERKEKLMKTKAKAIEIALKSLALIGTAALTIAIAGPVVGTIATAGEVIFYNSFAKKIRDGSWQPTNDSEKFLKYNLDKFLYKSVKNVMDLGSTEGKVR